MLYDTAALFEHPSYSAVALCVLLSGSGCQTSPNVKSMHGFGWSTVLKGPAQFCFQSYYLWIYGMHILCLHKFYSSHLK